METVEPLLKTVVKHVCKAIPDAQRGALLLQSESNLVLKACVPERARPSVSLYLARMAMEQQEAFTWRRNEAGPAPISPTASSATARSAPCTCRLSGRMRCWRSLCGQLYHRRRFWCGRPAPVDGHGQPGGHVCQKSRLQEELPIKKWCDLTCCANFHRPWPNTWKSCSRNGATWDWRERVEPVTILSADVRGFTALSAEMDPNDVMDMLNQLFGACIPLIFNTTAL